MFNVNDILTIGEMKKVQIELKELTSQLNYSKDLSLVGPIEARIRILEKHKEAIRRSLLIPMS